MNDTRKFLALLLLLLLPTLFWGLGERPVYKVQEVRIAETAREMLASGDWVIPRYNGEPRLQKPPLPYWLTAASYGLAGVGAWQARLPSALAGLALALLLWGWLRRSADAETAGHAALVLVVSYLGLRYFRSGEADALLLLFTAAACMLGHDILVRGGDRRQRFLFGLALGLGFLSKGPAALSIPLLSLGAYTLVERRAGRPAPAWRRLASLPGALALFLVGFGWYAWILWRLPELGGMFFGRQVDETFISGNHAQPAWWYLPRWFEFYAPWSVLIVPAAWLALRRRRDDDGGLPPAIRFCWLWLLVTLGLLSATVNKQTQYALLLAPPAAAILGHYLAAAAGRLQLLNRGLFALFGVLVAAGVVLAMRKPEAAGALPLWLPWPLLAVLAARAAGLGGRRLAVFAVAAASATMFLFGEAHLTREPHKSAAQALMRDAAGHAPLYQLDNGAGDGALSFYAGQVVRPLAPERLPEALAQHPEVWVVREEENRLPELPGVEAVRVAAAADLELFRLRRKE